MRKKKVGKKKNKKQESGSELEKRCKDVKGLPRYRVCEEGSYYCILSQFKCTPPCEPFQACDKIKKKLGCPYLGTLLFDFENNIYAVNCNHKKEQRGRKNDEI